jgi:head-tail adaptor
VTIHRPDDSASTALGSPKVADVIIANRWASVEFIRGREVWQGMQVQSDADLGVRLRYGSDLSGISAKWWLGLGTRTLQIVAVGNLLERNREYLLQCKEAS